MEMAKLFQNGQSQAVRLPKEFRFPGKEVFIKKIGNITILLPTENSWETLTNSLSKFSNDFMNSRNQPIEQQKRENLFE